MELDSRPHKTGDMLVIFVFIEIVVEIAAFYVVRRVKIDQRFFRPLINT